MHSNRMVLAAAFAAMVMLAGCKRDAEPAPDASPAPPLSEAPGSETAAPAPVEAVTGTQALPQAAPFDVTTVPVSEAPLGEWPYVTPPEGYELRDTRTLDLSQVPFWTGQMLQPVEGKVFEARIGGAGDKTYSRFEVLKRFDEALTALGAQKVTTSEIPNEVIDTQLPKDFGVEFNAGAGGYYAGEEVSTYVLRHPDRVVWFKVYSDGNGGSLLIAESEAPPAAATPAA